MTATAADRRTTLIELLALSQDEQVARLTRLGDPDEVLMALGDEAEKLAVTDAGRALLAAECLVPLADRLGSALGRARTRRARAHALCNAGRLEEGWAVCDEAAHLADLAGEPVEAGRIRLRSMQALGELGRFAESIEAGERARAAFLGAGQQGLAARAEVNLGIVYQRRDEPRKALDYFDGARPFLGDEPFALGTVDNNRGEALLALNDFAGAERAFRSALDHYEKAGAELVAAVAEGNLADLAARQGLLERAIHHFERARRRFETAHSAGHLARLRTEQAEAIAVLGLPQEALRQYEAALPHLDQAGQALEAARARAGLGRTLIRLGRLSEAQTALASAAHGFDQLGHATARARVDLVRAELAAANGLPGEAERLVDGAMSALSDQPLETAAARLQLGRLSLARGDLAAAEAETIAALDLARRLDLAPLLADVLHTAGRLRLRRGDRAAAVEALEAAVTQIERVRSTLHAERFRGAYVGDRLSVYDDLIAALLDEGSRAGIERAFLAAEQVKSRVLLDLVRGRLDPGAPAPDVADEAEQRLLDEFWRLRAELSGLYSRLADDERLGLGAPWQRAVVERERSLEELESRLSSTRGVAALYARPAGLAAVVAALPRETTLIEYATVGEEVLAFVAGAGEPDVVRRIASAPQLRDLQARLRFQLNRALRPGAMEGKRLPGLIGDVQAELAALHACVLEPLAGLLPAGRRLLIVPHGSLHLLPFHALWDGTEYLLERHEVHYAPSASLYADLAGDAEAARGRALVVGVADAYAPAIEVEARVVAGRLGASGDDLLLGAEATAGRVLEAAPAARVIHLACHATFVPAAPLGSGLRLADRWLTVRDILDARLSAGLVTLSGCETGRSLIGAGDEHVGLLRAFFAAGASSVLASLWRVNDESAMLTMDTFYRFLAASDEPGARAAALRSAQLEAMQEHPHPAFWAPFRLIGRP